MVNFTNYWKLSVIIRIRNFWRRATFLEESAIYRLYLQEACQVLMVNPRMIYL